MPARLKTVIEQFRQSDFIRHTMVMVTGTGVAQLLPVLIIPVLTRLYTPDEFGLFATFVSYFTILAIIAGARYEYAIIMPAEDRTASRLFQIAGGLSVLFGLLLFGVVFAFGTAFTDWMGVPSLSIWLWLLPLIVTAQGLFMTFSFGLNRMKAYHRIAQAKVSQSGVTAAIQILGGFWGAGLAGLIIGKVAGVCLSAFWLFASLFSKHPQFFRKESWSDLKKTAAEYKNYPKFNAPHALTNNVSNNIPVILFVTYFTETIAGLYAMAIRACYAPIQIISTAFGQVLGKKLAEIHNKNGDVRAYVKRVIGYLSLLGLIPFTLLFLAGPKVFGFILGSEWAATGDYVRILTPFVYLTFITQPLSYIPLLYDKQQKAMWIYFISLCLRLAGIFTGIWLASFYISLILYSATGVIVMLYIIYWYLAICKSKPNDGLIS